MVYRALLVGRNTPLIDLFFERLNDTFEVMTCSLREADIDKHIEVFDPEMVIFCFYNETQKEIGVLSQYRRQFILDNIPIVIIGSKEEINAFQKVSGFLANLEIAKPVTPSSIRAEIEEYFRLQEEQEKEDEKLRALSAARKSAKNALKQQVEEEAEAAAEDLLPAAKKADDGRRKHVLIIDDDPMMLKMIKEHLRDKYDTATAISGKLAYKFLENKTTDLILLDYEMPGEKGPEVMEHIRLMGGHEDTPIIFLTGVTEREKIAEALKLHPQGYLLKPIDAKKLMETVANFTA
ncbi:MAG: response regulator [Lachnospiraceae bacterium]|nr:response regulator [Lachnospiraceae bacterium]